MSVRLLGVVLICLAAVLNEWTVARLLDLHGSLEPPTARTAVRALQLVIAALGIWLSRRRGKVRRIYLMALPIFAIALLAGLEAVTRAALGRMRSPLRALSPDVGWATAPHVRLQYVHPAFGPVTLSTGPHGFRRFDEGSGPRIFAIGDSYTEGAQVSDGSGWYDHVAAGLPGIRMSAYGTGGYGSLQEYMILDRHFDSLRPDVVIWQFSANDLVNNEHYLEVRSPLSSRMVRPFLENGVVNERFAGSGMVSRYSRLVRFVDARLAMIRGHGFQAADLMTERTNYPDALDRSIRTTSRIMSMVRSRTKDVPIVAFTAEGDHFADSIFQALAMKNRWGYVTGVIDSVEAARSRGTRVNGLPRDGHWTAAGHAIAGRLIARHLDSLGLFRKND